MYTIFESDRCFLSTLSTVYVVVLQEKFDHELGLSSDRSSQASQMLRDELLEKIQQVQNEANRRDAKITTIADQANELIAAQETLSARLEDTISVVDLSVAQRREADAQLESRNEQQFKELSDRSR